MSEIHVYVYSAADGTEIGHEGQRRGDLTHRNRCSMRSTTSDVHFVNLAALSYVGMRQGWST